MRYIGIYTQNTKIKIGFVYIKLDKLLKFHFKNGLLRHLHFSLINKNILYHKAENQ